MDLKLRGKSALVSGSTAGIGFAIAQNLVQEGATVTIAGRSEQRVAEAVGPTPSGRDFSLTLTELVHPS